jgi:hypothetical protein
MGLGPGSSARLEMGESLAPLREFIIGFGARLQRPAHCKDARQEQQAQRSDGDYLLAIEPHDGSVLRDF